MREKQIHQIIRRNLRDLQPAYDAAKKILEYVHRVEQANKKFIVQGNFANQVDDNAVFEIHDGPNAGIYTANGAGTSNTITTTITEVDQENKKFGTALATASANKLVSGSIITVTGDSNTPSNNGVYTVVESVHVASGSSVQEGPEAITQIQPSTRLFTIRGDFAARLAANTTITVSGHPQTAINKNYTVVTANHSNGFTFIIVSETIPSVSGIGGEISWSYTTTTHDTEITVGEDIASGEVAGSVNHTYTEITVDETIPSNSRAGVVDLLSDNFDQNQLRQDISKLGDLTRILNYLNQYE